MNKIIGIDTVSHTMAFAEEVAVFAETNLGTRIVMTVFLDITAGDFKRKLEKAHASCFLSLGEIRVQGVMVKRKSRFYYIPESVPIKYIFGDNQKPWFIYAEARVVNGSQEPILFNSIDKFQIRHSSAANNSIEGVTALIQGESKKKIKKSQAKSNSRNLASIQTCLHKREFLCPSTSEPETTRSSLSIASAAETKSSECFNGFIPITPERKPVDSVSKKLTVAANNIRMQGKPHIPASVSSSIFRSKTRRNRSVDGKIVNSLAKFLVFEVPEDED